MSSSNCIVILLLFNFVFLAFGSDPAPLQDICVADLNNPAITSLCFDIIEFRVNGYVCKDPKQAQATDFFSRGFNTPAPITQPFGFGLKFASINEIPGLNTQGLTMARADFAVNGNAPLHFHPRACEIMVVVAGTLFTGFITTDNRLISKVMNQGDVFVIPSGLVHFVANVGRTPATAFGALNSQNPGVSYIASAAFGTKPPIPTTVLAKNFQIDNNTASFILSKFQ